MKIQDIWERRKAEFMKTREYPTVFLVTEHERRELMLEAALLPLQSAISNRWEWPNFKLFGVRISTKERETA